MLREVATEALNNEGLGFLGLQEAGKRVRIDILPSSIKERAVYKARLRLTSTLGVSQDMSEQGGKRSEVRWGTWHRRGCVGCGACQQ